MTAISLEARIKDQWHRIRTGLSSSAPAIDSMAALYRAEVRDLRDAELQVCTLADEIWVTIRNEPLAQRVSEYAGEMRYRTAKLDGLLSQIDAPARERSDEPMHALVHDASRMAELCGDEVRDIALVAALQRILHCLSADYATLEAHAAILGRAADAKQFAQYAERNKAVDDSLSALAEVVLRPRAVGAIEGSA